MTHINPLNGCVGCTACRFSCPRNAIKMCHNHNGFIVPLVDIDSCINCGLCLRVCPLNNNNKNSIEKIEAYSQYPTDLELAKKSTSGGVFYLMAIEVLNKGGYVCGCVWDKDFVARHVVTNKLDVVKTMRGSKYVQSDLGDCFKSIKELLVSDHFVLFCGTGCQTSGLINYVGEKLAEKLICVALVCGGVPSPFVWDAYKKALEKKLRSKISAVNMRNKKHGWLVGEFYVEFESGKKINENLLQQNLFGNAFNEGLIINRECLNCKFKLDTVKADIMIGDNWGINTEGLNKTKNCGSSVVLIIEASKRWLIDLLKEKTTIIETDMSNVAKSHGVLLNNHNPNIYRDEFFDSFSYDNVIPSLKKYFKLWEKNTHRSWVIPLLNKLKLYNIIQTLRWKRKNKIRQ